MSARIDQATFDHIIRLIQIYPTLTNRQLSQKAGVSSTTVWRVRITRGNMSLYRAKTQEYFDEFAIEQSLKRIEQNLTRICHNLGIIAQL